MLQRCLTVLFACVLSASVAAQQTPTDIATELRRLAALIEQLAPAQQPVVFVPPGWDVGAALTSTAKTGGIVELQAGATYPGPIQFPTRAAGAPLVTLRTRGTLPNRRISEADRPLLATIAAQDVSGALRFENTSGYVVDGVALTMSAGTHEVVVIQDSDAITLDRVLSVHPNGQKRIVRGNGTHITVTRSYLDGGAWPGQDSQAFCAWEGAGPYTITDNTLMASGENILFGGSDNARQAGADNPADILIEGNYFYKPLAWKAISGSVKNLLELKNATRVIIRNNLFENNWTDAQSGWSILFTPMNQDGGAPWSVVKDVLFERNYVKGVERGINMVGRSYIHVTQQASGITIRKNVLETSGQFLQASAEVADVTVEDNVTDNGWNTGVLALGDIREVEGQPTRLAETAIVSLTWNRNVHRDNGYGIHSEVGIGEAALKARTQSYTFLENRFQGLQWVYPAGTTAIDEATYQAAKAALLKELGR